jgi:Zn-dependent peptidase ImmA (M78 family)
LDFANSGAFDLMEAIVGPTTAVPNLTTDGERLAGMLDCTGIVPRVYYEAYDPLHRQRFSAAHEVGHFVLHENRRRGIAHGCAQAEVDPSPEDAETTSGNEEAEANAFAAALLLPAHDLQQAVQHFGLCSAFLAERFCVSEPALRRRWETLQGEPA